MASLGTAFAGAGTPAALITEVYGVAGPSGHYRQPLSIFAETSLRERYLSKRICAALAEMDKRTPEGDVSNLDFDVVSDSQDPDVHDLKIIAESAGDENAVVVANFKSHEDTERTELRFELVREDGSWKINNVEATGKSHWRVSEIIAGE
jgi:hypothetical protein